ncbi:MAG: WD40 repeat domain-containing protein [Anaerolineae bacterium]|nr:WD40 repeat domain-containing protein [Anaerolineae bacterium]
MKRIFIILLCLAFSAVALNPTKAQTPHVTGISAIAWNPDGSKVVVGYTDGLVRIWDTTNNSLLGVLEGHSDEITTIGWSPIDNRILTGGFDGTVRVWDSSIGEQLTILFEINDPISWVGWNPDGTQILTFSVSGGRFNIWDSTSYQKIKSGRSGGATQMQWSPDETQIAVATVVGRAEVWDTTTLETIAIMNEPDTDDGWNSIYAITWDSAGERIAFGTQDGWIRLWDLSLNQIVLNLEGTNSQPRGWEYSTIRALLFSTNDACLSSLSTDGMLKIWATDTGELLEETKLSDRPIFAAAFSPNGNILAFGGEDGELQFTTGGFTSINWQGYCNEED